MTTKLLLLVLNFAFLAVAMTGQENFRPKKKDLSWGREAQGLRMTVWTNPATDKIFAAIRNSSTQRICYCEEDGDNLTVYVRRDAGSAWQPLMLKTQPQEVVKVAICIAGNIKPNQEMPSYILQNNVRKNSNYSFTIDLRRYNFPSDWSGSVEAKIVQSNVYCSGSQKVGEVESQPFKVKLPFIDPVSQH
jgi:hypothetical protein